VIYSVGCLASWEHLSIALHPQDVGVILLLARGALALEDRAVSSGYWRWHRHPHNLVGHLIGFALQWIMAGAHMPLRLNRQEKVS
jgi:hypothetical protein